ncbi:predicted protein [Naegleria gruberi]|uniref:Predicted protein n=1 Tax=Naegleria gruberi TaxID=5762 RepID=D2VAV5_NAEGR|nr:uncharacterized protein NAEGRDRAFT_48054 [Naegleria gruberi]EFC46147.1 predicted protein [Naegleria gruberi]|eukprot:XP_002678891.1 predicted protein [Naegleria gruberi strain NEG-M]
MLQNHQQESTQQDSTINTTSIENRQNISFTQECFERIRQLPVQLSRDTFDLIHSRVKSFIFSIIIESEEDRNERKNLVHTLSMVCKEWRQLLKDLIKYKFLIGFDVHRMTVIGNKFDGFVVCLIRFWNICIVNNLMIQFAPVKGIKQRFLIIGNEENRRVGFFQAALSSFGLPPGECVTWEMLLSTGIVNPHNHQINVVDNNQIAPIDWQQIIDKMKRKYFKQTGEELETGDIVVRIDSPGENFFVERGLLSLGCEGINQEEFGTRVSEYDINNILAFDLGQVRYVRQWYLGFINALEQLFDILRGHGIRQFSSTLDEISSTFDKRMCHSLLVKHGIPVPRGFYNVRNYDEMVEVMKSNNMNRVFVKLAHGSSASGVIAYCFVEQRIIGSTETVFKELATTSSELVRDRNFPQYFKVYNSLRIRRYTKNEDIKQVIDFVLAEGAIVEEWVEKADYMGRGNFDLRIVVVGGKIMNFVVRTSRNPMTNLHLGNKRGECDDFLRLLEYKAPGSWDKVKVTCESIANECFPNSLCLGVDLMFSENFQEHFIVEVNGFGDLIPRIYFDNLDTYQTQVRESIERYIIKEQITHTMLDDDDDVE